MSEFDFDVVSEARPVPRRNPPAPAAPKPPAERQKGDQQTGERQQEPAAQR